MAQEEFSRIQVSGESLLRTLFELEAFRVCPLLEARDFRSWAEKCGLRISTELLEQFEKKQLFLPLIRVQFPIHREKRRRLENGTVESFGTFKDGDEWDGEVEQSYIWPNFLWHDLQQWMDEGFLFAPDSRPFTPWDKFRDEKGRQSIASYYSPFQIFSLAFQLNTTGYLLNAAYLVDKSDEEFESLKAHLRRWASERCDSATRVDNPRFDAVILAQAIASRYYPEARGDMRTITVPGEWDWHGFARAWEPAEIVARLGISSAEVSRFCDLVDLKLHFDDPLSDWDDLLRFTKREARDRLKGKARLGEELRAMREMFARLYRDLTGETLEPRNGALAVRYALNEGSELSRPLDVRRARAASDIDLFEFVVNRYGLNPRPALVLFVEGASEEVAISTLVQRVFGMKLAVAGIELRNLSGVAGFTGSKRRERYGALEKVIEELHRYQTVAFVVLDNEGDARNVRERLATKASQYNPKRTIIRREFIHIWERSIELDNFPSEEIAVALTLTSEGRYDFTTEEVAEAARAFGRNSDVISKLFESRLQYGLPKPTLLSHLVDQLALDHPATSQRPLLVLLHQVTKIAALNHKPTFVDTYYENQESGYLGHPIGDAGGRLTDAFSELRAIQTHLVARSKPSN